MSLFLRFRVSGHSMEPTIKNGQEILVSNLPYLFIKPKIGDIVAFKYHGKYIVKRISKIGQGKLLVKGDNKSDSKSFGWIDRKKILGKVIYI